jgi:hypothetical protein
MPRKVFEGFTPLDAEDVNEFLMNQSIMSFADSTARGSAIPTPSDGMASWLQDSDSFTIYDGSAWEPLGTPPTLVFLGKETFSAVSSVSIDDVFSADYKNYKVIFNSRSNTVDETTLRFRVRAGGSDLTSTTYEFGRYFTGLGGAETVASNNSLAATSVAIGLVADYLGYGSTMNVYDPFSLSNTKLHQIGGGHTIDFFAGFVLNSLSYDGCTFFVSNGTMTGTMSVYGIRES